MFISTDSGALYGTLSLCAARDVQKLQQYLMQNPHFLITGFQTNQGRRFLLHEVIITGDIDICKLCVEHARQIGQFGLVAGLENYLKRTPLMTAIIHDRREILQIMKDYGYNLKIDGSLIHPLELAAEHGSIQACAFYLETLHQHWDPTALKGPFLKAIENGNVDIAKLLLDYGLDVHAQIGSGLWKPLHYAAEAGQVPIIQLLLDHGAHIDGGPDITSYIWTPLALVTNNGHHKAVFALLQHNANRYTDQAYNYGCFQCYAEYGHDIYYSAAGDRFSDLLVLAELDYDMNILLNCDTRLVDYQTILKDSSTIDILRFMMQVGYCSKSIHQKGAIAELIRRLQSKIEEEEGEERVIMYADHMKVVKEGMLEY